MEDTTMMDGSQALFSDNVFTIIPNMLSEERVDQLTRDIVAAGGTVKPFDASYGRIDRLKDIRYIISATADFPDFLSAFELFIHIVKPSWVDSCLKAGKIKNPRTFSPYPGLFMSDVVVCCGEHLPQGDKEAIEGGIIAAGGQFSPVLSKLVTHLIALDVEDPRCTLAGSKRLRVQKLLPHWFDDCLKVGRRISERPYTLPDPEYLSVEAKAPPPTRTSPYIRDATEPEPVMDLQTLTPPERLEPARAIKAFTKKKVMLSGDLELNDHLKAVITSMIQAGGGEVTTEIDDADMYVCNYREGAHYIKASQEKKDVGNLSWLYYMIIHDLWTNPMRRMMHYPRPRGGIPGFAEKKYKISISSYTGEARVYLESLVKASGAEFTKTFRQDNTHLITAHKQSEKCEAAQEWGVHVVNSLWLEESYASCKEHTLTDPRYTYFPTQTNLGDILGQTEIDRNAVEKIHFPKIRKPRAEKTIAHDDPVPASSGPKSKPSNDPVARSSPLAEKTRRTKTATDVVTPSRRVGDGKENETPGTAGSRGAKNRAMSKLHEAAPDIAKFEKEMKRKGGVIHGRDRGKDVEKTDKPKKGRGRDSNSSKRSIDEVDEDEETEDERLQQEAANKNKKAKKGKAAPVEFRVSISKYSPWDDEPGLESRDKGKLRELGLMIPDSCKVDILCAPKPVTTKKFLCSLTYGPTLVSESYVAYALKHNKLPPPEKHLLHDPNFEDEYGCTLEKAVERAKQNQKRLLRDWTIFCSKDLGPFDSYKAIIEANGGTLLAWNGRTTTATAGKRSLAAEQEVSQNQAEDEADVLYLISDGDSKHFQNWKKFRELAKKHDMTPRIVDKNWLTHVAMAQKIYWDPCWELTEERAKLMQKP
ncbi:hypothetical protein K491DRAFT_764955 [Lophiostoma macrostomum CBS 122681]|uniref:BRCT domain-containing protein n=1 Tax=Lophiostoma macrostomum CBS 122681 TaxID=1314788 RepID=A0A6A6TNC0_9PLEO|nr:hypothetical protein K491DRAFT_764955 [Lophiostoma macrostomum CBS 122681]